MSHQPNQQQHARTDDQFGQRPAEMGAGGSKRGQRTHDARMTGRGTGRRGTGRPSGQGMQGGRETRPHSFEDHLTTELWIALEDFAELSHITAWCAKECAAAGIGTCARICQDVAEIAELNEMLISRDSMFGPEAMAMFVDVAREAVSELQQYHQRHPHVTETIAAIERTMDSSRTLLEMADRGGQSGREMSDRLGGGGTGGQPTMAGRGTRSQF